MQVDDNQLGRLLESQILLRNIDVRMPAHTNVFCIYNTTPLPELKAQSPPAFHRLVLLVSETIEP